MKTTRRRGPAAGLALASLVAACAWPAVARADETDVDAIHAPIVRVNVRDGNIAIRTWDRPTVRVDGDASLSIEHRIAHETGADQPILIPSARAAYRNGEVQLAPENFVVPAIAPGPRDVVLVRSTSREYVGTVTVTVPADSVYVFAHAMHGNLDVRAYRGGTLVAFVGTGALTIANAGGTAFVQVGRGRLDVEDAQFDRLRARSLLGDMTFERCGVGQIEATSVSGSIVYDAGRFGDGLARFESASGDVAVGAANGAQLGARAMEGGHVFTHFAGRTHVDARDDEADAVVGGGGPLVTATSGTGNVFLYEGSLRRRARMPSAWRGPRAALRHPR